MEELSWLVADGDLGPYVLQVLQRRAATVAGEVAAVLAPCCLAVDVHKVSRMDGVTKKYVV